VVLRHPSWREGRVGLGRPRAQQAWRVAPLLHSGWPTRAGPALASWVHTEPGPSGQVLVGAEFHAVAPVLLPKPPPDPPPYQPSCPLPPPFLRTPFLPEERFWLLPRGCYCGACYWLRQPALPQEEAEPATSAVAAATFFPFARRSSLRESRSRA
jgi:hypothetical protein